MAMWTIINYDFIKVNKIMICNMQLFTTIFKSLEKYVNLLKNPLQIFRILKILKIFSKFTGKYLCQCLIFNKVADLGPAKKETLVQVFSCEFKKFFKNTFLTQHLWTYVSATRHFKYEKQEEFLAYFLGIWLHLLKKSLMEKFIFCSVRLWSRYHNHKRAKKNWF